MFRKVLLTIGVIGLILASTTAASAHDPEGALDQAVEWLAGQQLEDGGYSTGFSPESDLGASADAAIAFASAGMNPAEVAVQDNSLLSYLEDAAAEIDLQGAPGMAAKLALAAMASGADPRAFGGTNLIALIVDGYDSGSGLFGAGPFDSSLAILALSAAGEDLPQGAVDGLLAARIDDGAYAFTGVSTPGSGDSNTTAMAVQALIAAGAENAQIQPSLDYFRRSQNDDGGWTYQKPSDFGEATDVNSTSLVMQALMAAGESLEDWGDPVDALLLFQNPSGAFGFNAAMPEPSLLATIQAIPALAGVDFTDIGALELTPDSAPVDSTLLLTALGIILGLILAAVLIGRQQRSRAA